MVDDFVSAARRDESRANAVDAPPLKFMEVELANEVKWNKFSIDEVEVSAADLLEVVRQSSWSGLGSVEDPVYEVVDSSTSRYRVRLKYEYAAASTEYEVRYLNEDGRKPRFGRGRYRWWVPTGTIHAVPGLSGIDLELEASGHTRREHSEGLCNFAHIRVLCFDTTNFLDPTVNGYTRELKREASADFPRHWNQEWPGHSNDRPRLRDVIEEFLAADCLRREQGGGVGLPKNIADTSRKQAEYRTSLCPERIHD